LSDNKWINLLLYTSFVIRFHKELQFLLIREVNNCNTTQKPVENDRIQIINIDIILITLKRD